MNAKKLLALLLCLVMAASSVFALAGCAKEDTTTPEAPETASETTTTTDDPAAPAEEAEAEKEEEEDIVVLKAWVAASLVTSDTQTNQLDSKIGKLIAEQTGVAIEATWLNPGADANEAFNLLVASGGYEDYDIIFSSNGTQNKEWQDKLVSIGAIVPINDYFNQPDKYPNLAAIPQNVLDACSFSDGNLYGFPHNWYEDQDSKFGFWAADGWYASPDILAAVGMTTDDLKTLDGVEAYLKAVKDQNLKNADGLPVQPLSMGQDAKWFKTLLTTFGVTTVDTGFGEYDGEMIHYRDHPQTKEALQWLNKLYNEGLVDPEFITQKNDQLVEKILNQRVGLVMDSAFDFWTAVTVGENEATKLEILDFPKVEGVDRVGTVNTYDPYGIPAMFITSSCSNPDAVAKLANWGSEVGTYKQWEFAYGPRGTTWDFDEELGEPYFQLNDEEIKAAMTDYNAMIKVGYGTGIAVAPFGYDLNYYQKANEEVLFWIFNMHKKNSVVDGYAEVRTDYNRITFPANGAWNTNYSVLERLDIQYFCQLVACDEGSFENLWNEYQAQLEQQGHWSEARAEFEAEYAKLA